MTISKDVPVLMYGAAGEHQPTSQPIKAAASLYGGTVITTQSGYITGSNDPVTSNDTVWGIYNGIVDSSPVVSTPFVGGTVDGSNIVGISTGSFFLAAGTGNDALTQADVGNNVYLVDKVTVGRISAANTRPVAGVLLSIDTTQTPSYAVRLGKNQSSGDV